VAGSTGVLRGQGVWGKSSSAGIRGHGAGSIVTDIIDSVVNNEASIRGACWGMEAKGG